jgi:transmembrane sensor
MTEDEYIKLYEKHLAGQCTPEEEEILKDFQDDFTLKDHPWDTEALGDQQEMEQRLLEQLQRRLHPLGGVNEKNNVRWLFWRYAAAVLLVGLSSYGLYLYYRPAQPPVLAVEKVQPKPAPDIAPGGDKAILTLSDGAQVVLNDAGKGLVAQQGKTALRKQADGQLEYITDASAEKSAEEEIGYNTVTTPRGGQYQITLPDGSRVWLNASSSIRFPTRFFGNERRVETTGEVYFEVHKDPSFPFHVSSNGHHVEVLGTTFNVMAYDDEAHIKTTLVEGSVKVSNTQETLLLKPGEQSVVHRKKETLKVVRADLDEALAWKTGQFIFNDEDLESIMRKVARWYDVEIDFKENFRNLRFTGGMSRFENVSGVLNMLELTGTVHFAIKERRIEVMR